MEEEKGGRREKEGGGEDEEEVGRGGLKWNKAQTWSLDLHNRLINTVALHHMTNTFIVESNA